MFKILYICISWCWKHNSFCSQRVYKNLPNKLKIHLFFFGRRQNWGKSCGLKFGSRKKKAGGGVKIGRDLIYVKLQTMLKPRAMGGRGCNLYLHNNI